MCSDIFKKFWSVLLPNNTSKGISTQQWMFRSTHRLPIKDAVFSLSSILFRSRTEQAKNGPDSKISESKWNGHINELANSEIDADILYQRTNELVLLLLDSVQ